MKKNLIFFGAFILNLILVGNASAQNSNSSHSSSSNNISQANTDNLHDSNSKISIQLIEKNISNVKVKASISTVNNYVALKFATPSNSMVVTISDMNNEKIITEAISNNLQYYSVNITSLVTGSYSMVVEGVNESTRNTYTLTIIK